VIAPEDVMLGLEGAIASAAALQAFIEDENDPVGKGLYGVLAGLETTRRLLYEMVAGSIPDGTKEAVCPPHPADQIRVERAGQTVIRICQLCNNVLEDDE
jgi:hypothetical protein